jgi:hypothetical protein
MNNKDNFFSSIKEVLLSIKHNSILVGVKTSAGNIAKDANNQI